MKSYFSLQWKRVMKVLPFVLVVTVVLFAGIAVVLSGLIIADQSDDKNMKLRIGVTGDTDNSILKMAIAAFQNFDESRFTITFVEMEEKQAEKELSEGGVTAYLILPDDFVEKAMRGEMEPLYYVTSAGATNIVTMFKNEITTLVTDVVVSSQKGSFGLQEALEDNDIADTEGWVDELAVEYVSAIMQRAKVLAVNELQITSGVRIANLYLCSLTVLFLMLLGLPFVAVYARRDRSLNVLLVSRGMSVGKQLYDEWLPHFLSLLGLAAVVFVPVICLSVTSNAMLADLLSTQEWLRYMILFVPVLAMVSAFNLFIFEVGGNVVSATLLHFFATLCMCYVSGCFYPVFTFPRAVQAMERFLPTGLARETLMLSFKVDAAFYPVIGVVAYGVLFFAAACAVRTYKVRRWEGVCG